MDADIKSKVLHYENLIENILKADLAELEKKLDEKNTEMAEFLQLKNVIETLKNVGADKTGFKTQVDLGSSFFIQANVEDASNILLDVGLGHFVEFSLDEAVSIINVRLKLFERQTENLRKAVARTNAHIKLILLGIRELQGLN